MSRLRIGIDICVPDERNASAIPLPQPGIIPTAEIAASGIGKTILLS